MNSTDKNCYKKQKKDVLKEKLKTAEYFLKNKEAIKDK